MKRLFVSVALCVLSVSSWAGGPPVLSLPPLPAVASAVGLQVGPSLQALPHMRKGAFDLRFVNVGQLVDLLYDDAIHVPHIISSEVLQDPRVVSFEYDNSRGDLHDFVKVFLDSLGFKVETRDGVDFVTLKDANDLREQPREPFVYHPKYRTAAYLSKLVQPLFQGRVQTGGVGLGGDFVAGAGSQIVAAPVAASGAVGVLGGAAAVPVGAPAGVPATISTGDDLLFFGKASEVRDLKKLLPELDTPPGEVVVRGWVYEVSDVDGENSAFSIAAHLLDGQLGVSNGSASSDANSLTFDAHFLNVAISALSSDSRFREVSDPNVRVVSGEKVSLNVGSQVPTLGSISYQGASGTPVQSVNYQDAGVIFEVEPTVLDGLVEVKLDEQISSFVATTTGVNNSPTKNTREMTTTVDLRDGEVVVLGGLVQDSTSSAVSHEGFLPRFLDGKSSQKSRTEVLLVLQVERVQPV